MRPTVVVNCAMSADGKIAGVDRRQLRISSPEDMARVNAMRRDHDAILVGVGTVLSDDPHLTVKGASPEQNPIRVVLDTSGRTPDEAHVVDGFSRTVMVTGTECDREWMGAEVIRCGKGRVDVPLMLEYLGTMGVRTLMVEGGGEVIASFFSAGIVDRLITFIGPMIIGGRDAPTAVDGGGVLTPLRLRLISHESLGNGVLITYEVDDAPPIPGR